jgi:hypothetical protein
LCQRRTFRIIDIGLHRARGHAGRTTRADRLAFDGTLDDTATGLLGHRNRALGTLDVASTGFRIDRDPLAVDIGRIVRSGGVHRLGHAHRAALQQRHPRSSGGKLSDGQFERHSR